MKHDEQHSFAEQNTPSADGATDAIAAMIIILCIAAMGILWVSGQG